MCQRRIDDTSVTPVSLTLMHAVNCDREQRRQHLQSAKVREPRRPRRTHFASTHPTSPVSVVCVVDPLSVSSRQISRRLAKPHRVVHSARRNQRPSSPAYYRKSQPYPPSIRLVSLPSIARAPSRLRSNPPRLPRSLDTWQRRYLTDTRQRRARTNSRRFVS